VNGFLGRLLAREAGEVASLSPVPGKRFEALGDLDAPASAPWTAAEREPPPAEAAAVEPRPRPALDTGLLGDGEAGVASPSPVPGERFEALRELGAPASAPRTAPEGGLPPAEAAAVEPRPRPAVGAGLRGDDREAGEIASLSPVPDKRFEAPRELEAPASAPWTDPEGEQPPAEAAAVGPRRGPGVGTGLDGDDDRSGAVADGAFSHAGTGEPAAEPASRGGEQRVAGVTGQPGLPEVARETPERQRTLAVPPSGPEPGRGREPDAERGVPPPVESRAQPISQPRRPGDDVSADRRTHAGEGPDDDRADTEPPSDEPHEAAGALTAGDPVAARPLPPDQRDEGDPNAVSRPANVEQRSEPVSRRDVGTSDQRDEGDPNAVSGPANVEQRSEPVSRRDVGTPARGETPTKPSSNEPHRTAGGLAASAAVARRPLAAQAPSADGDRNDNRPWTLERPAGRELETGTFPDHTSRATTGPTDALHEPASRRTTDQPAARPPLARQAPSPEPHDERAPTADRPPAEAAAGGPAPPDPPGDGPPRSGRPAPHLEARPRGLDEQPGDDGPTAVDPAGDRQPRSPVAPGDESHHAAAVVDAREPDPGRLVTSSTPAIDSRHQAGTDSGRPSPRVDRRSPEAPADDGGSALPVTRDGAQSAPTRAIEPPDERGRAADGGRSAPGPPAPDDAAALASVEAHAARTPRTSTSSAAPAPAAATRGDAPAGAEPEAPLAHRRASRLRATAPALIDTAGAAAARARLEPGRVVVPEHADHQGSAEGRALPQPTPEGLRPAGTDSTTADRTRTSPPKPAGSAVAPGAAPVAAPPHARTASTPRTAPSPRGTSEHTSREPDTPTVHRSAAEPRHHTLVDGPAPTGRTTTNPDSSGPAAPPSAGARETAHARPLDPPRKRRDAAPATTATPAVGAAAAAPLGPGRRTARRASSDGRDAPVEARPAGAVHPPTSPTPAAPTAGGEPPVARPGDSAPHPHAAPPPRTAPPPATAPDRPERTAPRARLVSDRPADRAAPPEDRREAPTPADPATRWRASAAGPAPDGTRRPPEQEPAGELPIQIRIGRIDARPAATTAKRGTPAEPRGPKLTLQQYLERRRRPGR
jgi:hypothetical protein